MLCTGSSPLVWRGRCDPHHGDLRTPSRRNSVQFRTGPWRHLLPEWATTSQADASFLYFLVKDCVLGQRICRFLWVRWTSVEMNQHMEITSPTTEHQRSTINSTAASSCHFGIPEAFELFNNTRQFQLIGRLQAITHHFFFYILLGW